MSGELEEFSTPESKSTPPADSMEELMDGIGMPREAKFDAMNAILDAFPLEHWTQVVREGLRGNRAKEAAKWSRTPGEEERRYLLCLADPLCQALGISVDEPGISEEKRAEIFIQLCDRRRQIMMTSPFETQK